MVGREGSSLLEAVALSFCVDRGVSLGDKGAETKKGIIEMSKIAHNRTLSMCKAYIAGRTSIYRNEVKNPYPTAEPELRAEYERGVSDIPEEEGAALIKA